MFARRPGKYFVAILSANCLHVDARCSLALFCLFQSAKKAPAEAGAVVCPIGIGRLPVISRTTRLRSCEPNDIALPRCHGAEARTPLQRLSHCVSREPCLAALWSVSRSVKSLVKATSFRLTWSVSKLLGRVVGPASRTGLHTAFQFPCPVRTQALRTHRFIRRPFGP